MPRAFSRPPDIAETRPVLSRRIPVASSTRKSCWGTLLTEWTYVFLPKGQNPGRAIGFLGVGSVNGGRPGKAPEPLELPREEACLGKTGSPAHLLAGHHPVHRHLSHHTRHQPPRQRPPLPCVSPLPQGGASTGRREPSASDPRLLAGTNKYNNLPYPPPEQTDSGDPGPQARAGSATGRASGNGAGQVLGATCEQGLDRRPAAG